MNTFFLKKILIQSAGRSVLFILFFFASLMFAGRVSAMVVSPVSYDLEIAPGHSVEKMIEIKNDTNTISFYSFSSENFLPSGEEGEQQYLSNSSKQDLASWISWKRTVIAVNPGETVRIPLTIRIPETAEPGGHYATLFISHGSESQTGSFVGMTEQVGVLFLVRVSGELTERASVESFTLQGGKNVYDCLPVGFDIRIRNEGSVHIRPAGELVIKNGIGKTVMKIQVNSNQGAILPSSIRRFKSVWEGRPSTVATEGFWSEAKQEWKQFAIGMYTAELRVKYGSQGTPLSASGIRFWVFPWRLGMIVVIGLILAVIFIRLYNRMVLRMAIVRFESKRKATRSRTK